MWHIRASPRLRLISFSLTALLVNASVLDTRLTQLNVTFHGVQAQSQVEQFLGIRYAHATSGERRFKAPVPYTYPPNTTVNAFEPPLPCSQPLDDLPPWVVGREAVGEDCLGLSITKPTAVGRDDRLPVLVWIHGGAIILGAGHDQIYVPVRFMQQSIASGRPVIYVSFNYRLGIFGFAAGEQLTARGDSNLGLRDQRMALEWIRDNIAAFGEDPSRITVFGQSAGGTTGAIQTMMFPDKPLAFQQLLTMSGPPGNAADLDYTQVPAHTDKVASKLSCLQDGSADFDCLRRIYHDVLLNE